MLDHPLQNLILLLLILALGTTLLQILHGKLNRLRWQEMVDREGMPDQLAALRPWASELEVKTRFPVKLKGRIDQALIDDQGQITILDTKTRKAPRTYPSDIVQLSVYKVCLERGMKKRVSPFGWIRIVHPQTREVSYRRVKLLDENYIANMYNRYWAIKRGKTQPICTCGGRFCRG